MASLLSRLRSGTPASAPPESTRFSTIGELASLVGQFTYGGMTYPLGLGVGTTYGRTKTTEFAPGLESYVQAVSASPPAFAAQLTRATVLSQARFAWRNRSGPEKGKVFGTTALAKLETPWPNGISANLISRMEWHAGLAGNSYVHDQVRRLRMLRPDWVTVIYGSQRPPVEGDAEGDMWDLDADLLGYIYTPGGVRTGAGNSRVESLLPADIAHWAPIPDPLGNGIGMSWLTPVLREIQKDVAATAHELRYFENGATPNLVVKGLQAADNKQFLELVQILEAQHKGVANAYKTLYLSEGADATVVGANLKDLDLKGLQGSSETRISAASRVPASVLSISEGLQGSSLNAGNFGQARRLMADTWLWSALAGMCGALGSIVPRPSAHAELWHDTTEMPFLRDDAKDAASVRKEDAATLRQLIEAGFEPDAAVEFLQAGGDLSKLVGKHTGKVSVQLQDPDADDEQEDDDAADD